MLADLVGSDIHVYYFQTNPEQLKFASELWERIRRECEFISLRSRADHANVTVPELRIYRFWKEPIGPHPIAMFEVNLFTPAQFGAFIPWLVINRGGLSVLIHPNTVNPETDEHDEAERDHTQRATWMGERVLLDLSLFKRMKAAKEAQKAAVEKKSLKGNSLRNG